MANKRKTKPAPEEAPATAGAAEVATSKARAAAPATAPGADAPEVPATLEAVHETITREEARLRIACALIQCPRFAHQVQVPAGQDYLVKVTDELTAKLGY